MTDPVVTYPVALAASQVDDVLVDYNLVDEDVDVCTITVDWSIDGIAWFTATESSDPSSDGLVGLVSDTTLNGGIDHRFVWDAAADLTLVATNVRIRITPDDGGGPAPATITNLFNFTSSVTAGAPYLWPGIFIANNTGPSGSFNSTPTVVQSASVLLSYNAVDEDTDLVSLEVQYSKDGGMTYIPAIQGIGGDGVVNLTTDTTLNGGIDHNFAWDTTAIRSAQVLVRARLNDPYQTSDWFYTTSFWVQNIPPGIPGDPAWWVPLQIPSIIYLMDPDQVIRYYADMLEAWRVRTAEEQLAFLDIFDVNQCPYEYLPYLASIVGIDLNREFPEASQRRQIRLAVQWYKEKGLPDAYSTRFAAIGYEAEVHPFWFDGVTRSLAPVTGFSLPDASIQLILLQRDATSPIDPTDIAALLAYAEQVRPAHVEIYELITGYTQWDFAELPTDEMTIGVLPQMSADDSGAGIFRSGVPHDNIDEVYWIDKLPVTAPAPPAPPPGVPAQARQGTGPLSLFNGTRLFESLAVSASRSLAGDIDPFEGELYDLRERYAIPETPSADRAYFTLAETAAAGYTLDHGGSFWTRNSELHVHEITPGTIDFTV